jgi:predicted O-methyltransferase YrrM
MGSTEGSLERPPPLVRRAVELADRLGFTRSCEPEVGRLLHVLAAQRGRARVGEIGTGTGVGAAWIVSALPPEVPFVTVELDPERAALSASLFAEDTQVRVLAGDWHELMPPEAPFDLLFYGGGKQRPDLDGEDVVALLAPRGVAVIDDLTPGRSREVDRVREFWLGHADLAAVELTVSAATAAIVAVRVR